MFRLLFSFSSFASCSLTKITKVFISSKIR